jgi:periplasmic divalent cation tolerance protein
MRHASRRSRRNVPLVDLPLTHADFFEERPWELFMDYSIVMTTCASREQGENLAEGIVRSKLAISVQITEVSSIHEWEGEFQKTTEFLLLIKGPQNLFPQLKEYLLANHAYEVPEILQLNIANGNPSHYAYTLGG